MMTGGTPMTLEISICLFISKIHHGLCGMFRVERGMILVRYSPALHDPLRKHETSSLVWREIYLTQMLHGAGFISLQFRPLCKCIGKYYSMEHSEFSFLVEPMIFRVQKGVSCTLMLMFQRSDHFTV